MCIGSLCMQVVQQRQRAIMVYGPMTCQVQIPERLGAALLAQHLNPGLSIPLLAPCSSRTDLGLDLNAMVGLLCELSDLDSVPAIAIPPFGKHGSAPFEISHFSTPDACTPDICANQEACHGIAGDFPMKCL